MWMIRVKEKLATYRVESKRCHCPKSHHLPFVMECESGMQMNVRSLCYDHSGETCQK
jgi:hypothetical protein